MHRDYVYTIAEDIKVLKVSDNVNLDLRNVDWQKYVTKYQMGIKIHFEGRI